MKFLNIFLVATSLIVASVASESSEADDVLVLTDDNFEKALEDNQHILVEFYAPWCGFCKKLAPEYAKAAETLKNEGSKAKLAKVDCTVETDLCGENEVKGYPTLKFFTKGEEKKYDGTREAEGIVEWVKKNSGEPKKVEKEAETADKAEEKAEKADPTKVEIEDDVLVLNTGNFETAIQANEFILVEFYAPWCGHCKKLAPEYAKAAKTLKDAGLKPKLAKVDATVESELGSKYGVRGYPTLKFFVNGEASDYSGPRDAEGIVQWIKKKSGPPATNVKTVDEFKSLKEANSVLVLGCFADQKSDKAKEFIEAAKKIDDIEIAITSNKDVMKENSAKDNSILVLKNFDDPKVEFDGDFKAEAIQKWAQESSMPLVWEFSQSTAQKIFKGEAKVHYIYFDQTEKLTDKVREALKPAAKEYKNKVAFVTVDISEAGNKNVLGFFGIKEEQAPRAAIFEMETNAKYLLDSNTEADSKQVLETVKKFFNGEIEKTLKTEEIPEDWDKEPVKVLVGKNFNKVAMDKSKNVFVEFYAPWCGHCKALAPTWDDLAKEFENDDSVLIAKVDATANECEGVNIKSFPTLKMWKKDTNEMVDYSGARDLETLKHFVKTGEMSLPKKEEEPEQEISGEKKKDEL